MFKNIDELTQEELYKKLEELREHKISVVLVDTILKPINTRDFPIITYNPHEMSKYDENTLFVFYCDSGKSSKERLAFYRSKLPNHQCISLKGGRGYWRPSFRPYKENK